MKKLTSKIYFLIQTAFVSLVVFSCAPISDKPHTSPADLKTEQKELLELMFSTSAVPNSKVFMTNTEGWESRTRDESLIFSNSKSSSIIAKKYKSDKVLLNNPQSLKLYLESQNSKRNYKNFDVNGLKGIRADISDAPQDINLTEIFFFTELGDVIQILVKSKENDGAEDIILSARIKTSLEKVNDAKLETITLEKDLSTLQIPNECKKKEAGCDANLNLLNFDKKIGEMFVSGNKSILKEIGEDKGGLFDSLIVQGEFITSNSNQILISSLNQLFFRSAVNKDLRNAKTIEGHVYLLRYVNLPDKEIVIKLRIDKVQKDVITLTYKKLLQSSHKQSLSNLRTIERNQFEKDKIKQEGEVVLFQNEELNLRFAKKGIGFEAYFAWRIQLKNKSLILIADDYDTSQITFTRKNSLAEVDESDFPKYLLQAEDNKPSISNLPLLVNDNKSIEFQANVPYILHQRTGYDLMESKFAALQVVEVGLNEEWVRVKYKIIDTDSDKLKLPKADSSQPEIEPLIGGEALVSNDPVYFLTNNLIREDAIIFSTQYDDLSITNNPLGKERGFYNFGNNVDFTKATEQDVKKQIGKFVDRVDVHVGDTIGVYLENYSVKTLFLIKIISHIRGEAVFFHTRQLDFSDKQNGELK